MADNLTLFCLVDGVATTNAFPVEIESTKTIGDLKKFIKKENTPEFDDFAPDKLTLWRVSIPDNKQGSAITIDALDDKTELNNPRTRLSKLFSESPDDNTPCTCSNSITAIVGTRDGSMYENYVIFRVQSYSVLAIMVSNAHISC
ncbi:hypothetical protein EC957_009872 [Mortierella hygrophila]|uniref:Crinkler effector protein N-terminal domain-containing protein n=1 Tax=Mortierella hygrophila TaxID=979708 RepID=A0A9P6EV68_9FUNG|nr:hypothetical protein EC957_009872 [Mortierella hygrophila]